MFKRLNNIVKGDKRDLNIYKKTKFLLIKLETYALDLCKFCLNLFIELTLMCLVL